MRNDQIFVLLLVILLPLSGCFDGAVGDAEGTDDASSGTTIVNNYYNNTSNLTFNWPSWMSKDKSERAKNLGQCYRATR